jgi:hypothetical protein
MGVLYRGRDTVLDREVAIKVMAGDFSSDETARTRFFREARAAARLQHRNVVTVFEFAEQDDSPYIVMEYLRGRSLAARLKDGPELALADKLDIVIQLCAGLDFAHREGLVHRDVKPANIWLCEDGSVKLLDFGLAKSTATTATNYGSVLGSPSYMSPEQIAARELDGRSDVFSAGVVLYEMLSGRKPFEADSPTAVMMKIASESPAPLHELRPELSSAILTTVERALAKDIDQRYRSAADFAVDLRLVLLNLETGYDLDPSMLLDETLAVDRLHADDPTVAPLAETLMAPRGTEVTQGTEPALQGMGPSRAPAPAPDRQRPWLIPVVAASIVIVALAGVVTMWKRGAVPAATVGLAATAEPAPPAAPGTRPSPPETPAPPARTLPAVLRITSTPAGAAITVDGKDSGQITPFDLPLDDRNAPQRIRLSKRDYEPAELALTSEILRSGAASIDLDKVTKAAGRVVITGSYPFEVLEGSRVVSSASETHQLTLAGRHTLRLRARDVALDRVITVDPPAGGRVETRRAPGVGQLIVNTAPAFERCTVYVSGLSLGPPPTDPQRLVEGPHTIQLKCPSGEIKQKDTSVIAGELRTETVK